MYAYAGAYPSSSFCRPVRQVRDEAKIVAPAACRLLELRKKVTPHDDREIHIAEDGPVNADLAPNGTRSGELQGNIVKMGMAFVSVSVTLSLLRLNLSIKSISTKSFKS